MRVSEERRAAWRERVAAFRTSGQSVAVWCREQRLKEHQMRYWLRRFASIEEPAPSAGTWLSVALEDRETSHALGGVLVHVGRAAIEVRPGFDRALLADVVAVLSARC